MPQITVLGSGTCVSSFYKAFDFRYPSGYLLQNEGKNYLIDCSEGIRQRLEKLKIDYFGIDDIFISHFHPDHFILATFVQSLMVRVFYSGGNLKKNLTVYGPEEAESRFRTIWDACHNPGDYDNVLKKFVDMKFVEYVDSEKINVDNMILVPYRVVHGDMAAYALRFEMQGKTLSYSGDSGLCPGIEKVCRDSDIFISEASLKIGDYSNPAGHLNPYQAGLLSKKGNVKKLVLTHFPGADSGGELKEEVKRSGFTGAVSIASDFQKIVV